MDRTTIFLGIINSFEEYLEVSRNILNGNFEINEDIEPFKIKPITITEEEIKKYFGNYKDIKELREIAIKYFADNLQGYPVNIGKLKNIRISRNSRDRYKKYSHNETKLLIVPKLREILETARYKNSSPKYKERKDNIYKFHYFINEVIIKDKEYGVYITIGEDENGNLFYDLDKNKTLEE